MSTTNGLPGDFSWPLYTWPQTLCIRTHSTHPIRIQINDRGVYCIPATIAILKSYTGITFSLFRCGVHGRSNSANEKGEKNMETLFILILYDLLGGWLLYNAVTRMGNKQLRLIYSINQNRLANIDSATTRSICMMAISFCYPFNSYTTANH